MTLTQRYEFPAFYLFIDKVDKRIGISHNIVVHIMVRKHINPVFFADAQLWQFLGRSGA